MTNDPDLDQAIDALRWDARRLRDLQRQVHALDPVKDYSTLAARKFELADLEESFRVRGETLQLSKDRRLAGRALLLVVEQAGDLYQARRKRPSARELTHALRTVTTAAERDREEAEAALVIAQHAKVTASFRAAAGASAIEYLEASR